MPLIDKLTLISSVCPPLDTKLIEQLIAEFVSQERRYILRDWEPATLDGGQFAEAAARILYHQDSKVLNHKRSVGECLTYVEDPKNANSHQYPDRKSALHTARVIRTIYKFRSDRGAVHIDPEYDANQLDSKLVIENSRWVLSEILRIFWTGDRSVVAAAIREIIQYDIPVIGNYEGRLIVQREIVNRRRRFLFFCTMQVKRDSQELSRQIRTDLCTQCDEGFNEANIKANPTGDSVSKWQLSSNRFGCPKSNYRSSCEGHL